MGVAAVAGAGTALGQYAPSDQMYVRLIVSDRSGMFERDPLGTLCMASNLAGFSAKGHWSCGHLGPSFGPEGEIAGGWMFEIPRSVAERSDFRFKFTRCDWGTAEVDGAGKDVEWRSLPKIEWRTQEELDRGVPAPEVAFVVEGFADQRGTRFPAAAPASPSAAASADPLVRVVELPGWRQGETRRVVVRLPTYHAASANAGRKWAVLYVIDSDPVFSKSTKDGRSGGDLLRLARDMEAGGSPIETMIVGIEVEPEHRTRELLEARVDPGLPRVPFGEVDKLAVFVTGTVMAEVEKRFGASGEVADRTVWVSGVDAASAQSAAARFESAAATRLTATWGEAGRVSAGKILDYAR